MQLLMVVRRERAFHVYDPHTFNPRYGLPEALVHLRRAWAVQQLYDPFEPPFTSVSELLKGEPLLKSVGEEREGGVTQLAHTLEWGRVGAATLLSHHCHSTV